MTTQPPTPHPIDSAQMLAALRELSGCAQLDLASDPVRLAFGGEAVIDVLELRAAPPQLAGQLVVRRVFRPVHPQQVLREFAVHRALAEQGFPVPRVHLFDATGERLGVPFLVMDRIAGKMPLPEVMEPAGLLRRPLRLPALVAEALWQVPALLGKTQAHLHSLDVGGLLRALADQGLATAEIGFRQRLDALEAQADRADLAGLVPGFEWLRRNERPQDRQVICHGDLVFTNIQVESGRLTGVLDWSQASVGEPEYDVAATLNRLESPVPGVPSPLAAIFRAVQRRMSSSYLRAYRQAHRTDPAALRYYAAFWLLQELVVGGERLRGGAAASGHITDRWLNAEVIRAGARGFEEQTRVVVEPLMPAPEPCARRNQA